VITDNQRVLELNLYLPAKFNKIQKDALTKSCAPLR
jgi:hypothetical protein